MADNTPGSGQDHDRVSYRVNGGSWSAWADTSNALVEVPGTGGDVADIEAISVDAVGNESAVGSAQVTVSEQTEDPLVRDLVAVLVVRSDDDGFTPLGQDRGPTAGDVAWTSLALLALFAVAALARRASAPGHRRTSPSA